MDSSKYTLFSYFLKILFHFWAQQNIISITLNVIENIRDYEEFEFDTLLYHKFDTTPNCCKN